MSASKAKINGPAWSLLPGPLLSKTTSSLTLKETFATFRRVCRAWTKTKYMPVVWWDNFKMDILSDEILLSELRVFSASFSARVFLASWLFAAVLARAHSLQRVVLSFPSVSGYLTRFHSFEGALELRLSSGAVVSRLDMKHLQSAASLSFHNVMFTADAWSQFETNNLKTLKFSGSCLHDSKALNGFCQWLARPDNGLRELEYSVCDGRSYSWGVELYPALFQAIGHLSELTTLDLFFYASRWEFEHLLSAVSRLTKLSTLSLRLKISDWSYSTKQLLNVLTQLPALSELEFVEQSDACFLRNFADFVRGGSQLQGLRRLTVTLPIELTNELSCLADLVNLEALSLVSPGTKFATVSESLINALIQIRSLRTVAFKKFLKTEFTKLFFEQLFAQLPLLETIKFDEHESRRQRQFVPNIF
jgi:hypothetical protein